MKIPLGLLIPIALSKSSIALAISTKRQGEVTGLSRSYGEELQRSIFIQVELLDKVMGEFISRGHYQRV